jgi:hypothetical protein
MTDHEKEIHERRIIRLEEFVLSIITKNPQLRISLPDDDTPAVLNQLAKDIEQYGDNGEFL